MSEIIEQIGDSSYPVGLIMRMGILGTVSADVGSNIMCAIGEASHGPGMTVMPLTSSDEVETYFQSGPLARAGRVAFAQGLPAGWFIRAMGSGFKSAQKYAHDGLKVVATETFYGSDGDEGPYPLAYHCYTQAVGNSVAIGVTSKTIVYDEDSLVTGKVYLDQENGTLTFYTGEGPDSDELVTCSLEHYVNTGLFSSPNSGIQGNSAFVDVSDGTFHAHDVEEFAGDGSAGPYYLKFHDLVEDDDNKVTVADVERTIVYSSGSLATGKVYCNIETGALTFFAGQEPATTDAIVAKFVYETKKLTIYNGTTQQPALDSLADLDAIQAALIYSSIMNFTPDANATHLPANGRYQLVGGDDGDAITTDDYADAMDVLMQYIEDNLTYVSTVVFCRNNISGVYDLIPILAGKVNEMKTNFYPAIGFIGLDENIDPDYAAKIARNFANRELVIVANPWDTTQPYRLDGTVARAAQTAAAPLGTSCARRVSNMSLQGLAATGLLNTYRRETVKNLHNNRLDVLVKSDAGIFSFYGRNTADEEQYRECVDVCTINYMTRVIKYYTDRFYFAKNTPSVRATLKADIDNRLDALVSDEVVDAYTTKVTSGRAEGDKGLARVKMEVENVGHIKKFIVDYYNGIIESAKVA
jgi:hypothetical protein